MKKILLILLLLSLTNCASNKTKSLGTGLSAKCVVTPGLKCKKTKNCSR